ncbi:uncharacterized protein PHACADRAFT_253827 [Phanerochaete carnosa HHB-10118-sp]|uniref:Yeast cell wall synthesis Kre9/Knh1-like N-terminal domain-containing protein n=1 Tax=Phanerochaete carnosa (strain HHB-10118-sp) TaxID=650164 RepID=K5X1G7_PHACS|nr:uncharacterized protein PHACADRAFT_253827 [Phanerochaete carnosa HHB-10118-sp]EKM56617.1 hypothetical protein PHACADRAFT_253827 [Phanerochaete carnosa HHB-10118-sp]
MISPRLALSATLAALVSTAAADLQIISPGGPNLWWVAGSINTIAWNCQQNTEFLNFTVSVGNSNPAVLNQPQAIIAVENNFDCSKTITPDQESFAAGDGYFIQFGNTLNSTDVYAQSQPFEIKPLGSAYPATSATPTEGGASATASGSSSGSPSASGSGSGSGAAAQTSAPANSASGLTGSVASVVAVVAGVFGLMFA